MRNDCVFCAIIDGEIPSTKVYEDDMMMIFRDVNPVCKNHYLAILKEHFKYLADMTEKQADMFKKMIQKINSLKKELELENGFRLVINQGEDAMQTVPHLHVHILSGEKLGWPPL